MSSALEDQVTEAQAAHDALEAEHGSDDPDADTETVDELAEKDEPMPPMQIPLEGLSDGISVVIGGDRPQTSSITLRGGKLHVSGEFKKGDVIELYVRAKIGDVGLRDTHDKFGVVVGTDRYHVARPLAVRRLSASET